MSEFFTSKNTSAFIGMIHLKALPGSPNWQGSMQDIIDLAMQDAEYLLEGGCDALIVENMNDLPYLKGYVYPETIAAMSIVVEHIMSLKAYTGIQVLAGANKEALAIASVTGASFIRAEGFAYAHVADEGWIDACAGELLRTRKSLSANVQIWADVQKKHAAHTITNDVPLSDLAKGTKFCGADALVVTGTSTGEETSLDDIKKVKLAQLPTIVGSGVTNKNIQNLAKYADALIVGSWLKKDGNWTNPVSLNRVKTLKKLLNNTEKLK